MADQRLIYGLAERHYDAMATHFARYPLIEEVLIFGSRAKGYDKPGSDFDLAVVGPELSDRDFSDLWNEIDDLPLVFKIDLLHYDRLPEGSFKEKIRSEGKRFYPLPD